MAGLGALFILGMVVASALRLDTPVAHAASITVDSTDDIVNDDGNCTLREAILAASTDTEVDNCTGGDPGADTITFDSNLNGSTITLGDTLEITSSMTIQGPGTENLAISGDNAVRVFEIGDEAGSIDNDSIDVTIDSLTISDGSSSARGGGIAVYSQTLTVVDSLILENEAAEDGGGIYSLSSRLVVTGTDILSNTASPKDVGGGMLAIGSIVNIAETHFVGNMAAGGGGLYGQRSALDIRDSLFHANKAITEGGALLLTPNLKDTPSTDFPLVVNIVDSEFTNNTALSAGAIGVAITTTIQSSLVAGNAATGTATPESPARGGGGGVLVYGSTLGPLTIIDSALRENISGNSGGGLNVGGRTQVISSTFMENSAAVAGGGIANLNAVSIRDTTIYSNTTTGAGGGIFNGVYLEMVNSTVSGNTSAGTNPATSGGGALAQTLPPGVTGITPTSVISYSTIVNNNAVISPTSGIGILNGVMGLGSSIVANNGGTNNFAILPGSTFASQGYNLTNSAAIPLGQTTDITGQDPLLGPLAYNGGTTWTHRPLTGSPAIDVIPAAACAVATDQRGAARPADELCDIGSVEAGAAIFGVWLPFVAR
jgi:CSLREA domain-containing protein